MSLPLAAYARAGLSNRFCPSVVVVVVVVCHKKNWKNLQTGDLEAATISKQEINAVVRDTVA